MNARTLFPAAIIGSSLLISTVMLFRHSQHEVSRRDEKPSPFHRPPHRTPVPAAPAEPAAILTAILRKADPLDQSREVIPFLERLTAADYPAMLDQCHNQHLNTGADLVKLLLAAWTKADPEAAAAYSRDDESALETVITTWSATAPADALAWLQTHSTDNRTKALQAVTMASIPGMGPEKLSPFLLSLPASIRNEALGQLIAHFAVQGTDAGRQWLESLTDPELHREALASFLENSTPGQAGEWLLTYHQILESSPPDRLYQYFTKWETADADATRKIFDELPSGTPLHRTALVWLASSREAQTDPRSIYSIIEEYPDEQDGEVLAYFCRSATKADPELAANVSLTIRKPNWETDTVVQSWVQQDFPSAKIWIEQNYAEKGARFLQAAAAQNHSAEGK